jgi:hypothetical protein
MPAATQTLPLLIAALAAATLVPTSFASDFASDPPPRTLSPQRGYEVLRTKPFLPADFDDGVFNNLWTVWPEDARKKAAAASPEELRRLTFERYGLHEPPGAPPGYAGPAIGYVDDGAHGWVMNCFACHAGQVAGRTVPGAPNADIDLQSLVEDVRAVKLTQLKPLTHLDLGSLKIPLGGTRGTTNSVVFGILLDGFRRPDMSVDLARKPGPLDHHDMDAPAWWNVRKKSKLYVDGFAPKNHRILMQFMLIPKNDRDTIYSWEDGFRDVLAYINSLEPPKYPGHIDESLALRGKVVFEKNCAECHGTYSEPRRSQVRDQRPAELLTSDRRPLTSDTFPQRIVPIADLGTDSVRLGALTVAHREHLKSTWMTDYGRDETIADPGGYVAPPLDGVWASAPYFHNGSVPTLWHVLHPDARPKLWRRDRTADGYDHHRIGLAVEELKTSPKDAAAPSARREVFDTTKHGKSAAGHDYPNLLTEDEKRAVLEYLKSL